MFWIWLGLWAISTLILAISMYYGIKEGVKGITRMKMQSKSVIARYRNSMTKAMMKDLLDIRVIGIFGGEEKVKDILNTFMPNLIEELERQRIKDPYAFQESMKYLAPIALTLKIWLRQSPSKMLEIVKQQFGGQLNVSEPNPNPEKPSQQNKIPGEVLPPDKK